MQTNVGGKCIPKHDCLARSGSGAVGNLGVGRKTRIVNQRLHQTHTYAYAANLKWSSVIKVVLHGDLGLIDGAW